MMSIRKRLLIWLFSALLLAATSAGIAIYMQTLAGVDEVQDYALRQIAYSMRHSNKFSPPAMEEDRDEGRERHEHETALSDNDNLDFIGQIWNSRGKLYLASNPDTILPRFDKRGIETIHWKQRDWRIFGLSEKGEFIQVAQPLGIRTHIAADIAARALIPIVALVPVLGILIWLGVSYGLSPLQRVTSAIGKRHADAMRPLPEQEQPREIRSLVAALNGLLKRLYDSFEVQKRFVADAAHQLRTPLTALHLQAEMMSRARNESEKAEAFSNLQSGIVRTSRLVEQLLTLVRQQPEVRREDFVKVDLDAIAREVIGEISPLAEAAEIDLGLDSAGNAPVRGSREALTILLTNLIDNAIRYSPDGSRIDVRIGSANAQTILEVEDDGPGIPQEEMGRVFDRFYRGLGVNATGSGLGLAIVRNIVDAHEAKIDLSQGKQGKGLLVRIAFPAP